MGQGEDKMVGWGTVLDLQDRGALADYLSINFPRDTPANPVTKVARSVKKK
jgi:hypothetical protein